MAALVDAEREPGHEVDRRFAEHQKPERAVERAALRLAPRDLAADPGKLDFELRWRMPVGRS